MTDHSPTIQGAELPPITDRSWIGKGQRAALLRKFIEWQEAPVGDASRPFADAIDEHLDMMLHTYARAAIAADRASRAAGQTWQPIETAPQTGRTLLLGYFNALGKWRTLRGQWFTDAVIQEEWTHSDVHEAGWFETYVECDDEDSGCWPCDPTHWMPLPSAPGAAPQSSTLAPEASAAQPAPAQAVSEASPDVAKMVEEAPVNDTLTDEEIASLSESDWKAICEFVDGQRK